MAYEDKADRKDIVVKVRFNKHQKKVINRAALMMHEQPAAMVRDMTFSLCSELLEAVCSSMAAIPLDQRAAIMNDLILAGARSLVGKLEAEKRSRVA